MNSTDRRIRHLAGRALVRSTRQAGPLYPGPWMGPGQLRAIAWVLGEIGDRQSSRPVTRLLSHRDDLVRARAAAALGKIADPASGPALQASLRDISAKVRASAATALGQLALPETRQWLEASLSDPHPHVRSAARAAIRHQPR
jgi:HEAT repeat protein